MFVSGFPKRHARNLVTIIFRTKNNGSPLYSSVSGLYIQYIFSVYLLLGTGSGVGTNVLGLLEQHYPEVYRFTTAVYPSDDDDVITSPYNR